MMIDTVDAVSIGREFVRQYYAVLHHAPQFLFRFYGSESSFACSLPTGADSSFEPVRGKEAIRCSLSKLDLSGYNVRIRKVDFQVLFRDSIVIQAVGELYGSGRAVRRFTQTFILLLESSTKYYIHNDILHYHSSSDFINPRLNAASTTVKTNACQIDLKSCVKPDIPAGMTNGGSTTYIHDTTHNSNHFSTTPHPSLISPPLAAVSPHPPLTSPPLASLPPQSLSSAQFSPGGHPVSASVSLSEGFTSPQSNPHLVQSSSSHTMPDSVARGTSSPHSFSASHSSSASVLPSGSTTHISTLITFTNETSAVPSLAVNEATSDWNGLPNTSSNLSTVSSMQSCQTMISTSVPGFTSGPVLSDSNFISNQPGSTLPSTMLSPAGSVIQGSGDAGRSDHNVSDSYEEDFPVPPQRVVELNGASPAHNVSNGNHSFSSEGHEVTGSTSQFVAGPHVDDHHDKERSDTTVEQEGYDHEVTGKETSPVSDSTVDDVSSPAEDKPPKPMSWAKLASKKPSPVNQTVPQPITGPARTGSTPAPAPTSTPSANQQQGRRIGSVRATNPPLPRVGIEIGGGEGGGRRGSDASDSSGWGGGGPARNFHPPSQQLFVGNLPHNITADHLTKFIEGLAAGVKVLDTKINRNAQQHSSHHVPYFAFVTLNNRESVRRVLDLPPARHYLDGAHRLNIMQKLPKSELQGPVNQRP